MPPFLGPFSSLARFALRFRRCPLGRIWVNPVLNQTGFTTKTRLVRLEKDRPGGGWAQAARRALEEHVQVRQAKYRACRRQRPGGAARARASGPWGPSPTSAPGRVRVIIQDPGVNTALTGNYPG